VWNSEVGFAGLTRKPKIFALGTSSRSNSSRFAPSAVTRKVTPVTLAPGRLRLETRPSSWTGSAPTTKTIGMVPVAALAASAAGGPNARITATGSASGQSRQPVEATIGRAIFDRNVTTFDIASLLQALPNGAEHSIIELSAGKQADQRHAGLLRPRR